MLTFSQEKMFQKQSPHSKAEILIVDDTPSNLRYLAQLLSQLGYKVQVAESGLMALNLIESHHPDLILLDIKMPELDGFAVCQKIKDNSQTKNIPIIFISSLTEVFDKVQAFSIGGIDYITKPFEPLEVLIRIETHLRLRSLQIELTEKNKQLEEEVLQKQQAELELTKLNLELEKLANIDGLTGIPNRRQFDLILKKEWYQMKKAQLPLSLIMCDIDYFKNYNDHYGHVQGDDCLRKVAQEISQTLYRSQDLVARYGGEEFVIVLPNTNIRGAIIVAQKVQTRIEFLKIIHDHSDVSQYLTLSMGVSCLIPIPKMSSELLKITADEALYHAKKQGRNRIETAVCDLN